jgi:transposase InsO family protein
LLVASPIPNQESKTVAKSFVTNVICQYGTPHSILSDQGTNFMGQLFKDICKLLSIKKLHSTSYHPQTQGSAERSHRIINEYLRSFINKDANNWEEFLPYATFTYNTTPHTERHLHHSN